jgi:hypothetical protein
MLGHPDSKIRDEAIILLNVLQDGVDWQKKSPYKAKISQVGFKFRLETLFEFDEILNPDSIVLMLNAFIFDVSCKNSIISWHRPKLNVLKSDGVMK